MKISALVYIFNFYYKKLHMLFWLRYNEKITSLIEYIIIQYREN